MIAAFKDEYKWLSNMAPVNILYKSRRFYSVETAYQSEKSSSEGWKDYCAKCRNPYWIKKESRSVNLVDNWDEIRVPIMRTLLHLKFIQEPYMTLLMNTGDEIIQEGNYWHDTFWGVDLLSGKGSNHLGIMIMEIRDNFTRT